MISASYSVIRYIADPGRNEPLNIGIVIWSQAGVEFAIDPDAVARVVRENPRLHPDSLLYLEESLRDQLGTSGSWSEDAFLDRLRDQKGFPVLLSERRLTSIAAEGSAGLRDALDHLVDRIVRPRRRFGSPALLPARILEHRIEPLLNSRRVTSNHFFQKTGTGIPRRVDFFANSGANVAVDALRLDLKRAEEIRLRADAEANKVSDIRARNDVRVLVFTAFSPEEGVQDANSEAKTILSASNAELIEDVDQVAGLLLHATQAAI